MTLPSSPPQVAIYLRKSRADLEAEARGEGETLRKHRQSLFDLARRNSYSVMETYEELHSGELISDRPQMQRLLQDVSAGHYDAVLCMDLDRLGRGNLIDQGLIQQAFKYSNTLIVTPRKAYNLDDELDEEWSEFESFLARRELKLITRRMHRGRRQSAAQGKFVGKQAPYGYRKGADLKLYPNSDTAPIVQMIYQWRAGGMGRNAIANRLSDLHIAAPSGPRWEGVTVRDILSNEVYIGRIIFGKRKFSKDPNGKKHMSIQPRDEWTIADHAHEPLIDEDLWNQVQQVNSSHTPHTVIDYSLKNPLAGVLRCGICGKCMVRRNHSGRLRAMVLCPTHGCPTRISRFDDVELRLLEQLKALSKDFPSQDMTLGKSDTADELKLLKEQLRKTEDQLTRVAKQKDHLHDLLEQGVYDVDTFLTRNKKLTHEMSDVSNTLDEINEQIAELEQSSKRRTNVLPALSRFIDEYSKAESIESKNQLLKAVVSEVRYFRRKEWPLTRPFELEVYLNI